MMSAQNVKVEAQRVSLRYPGVNGAPDFTALQETSFAVEEGQFVCLVGPSGCGKTSILKAIAGLLEVTGGCIKVNDQINKKPGLDRAVVFQYDSLLPWRTVFKNALLGWDIRGGDRAFYEEKTRYYLKLVGLEKFLDYYPHQLSGGMRQRVNLARALAVEPDILLMDEPFAALDAQTREVMQAELLRIWGTTGKTVIFVTHQVDEAVYLADRVIVMGTRPGRVVDDITIEFARPRELGLKTTPAFNAISERIWGRLASESDRLKQAEAAAV